MPYNIHVINIREIIFKATLYATQTLTPTLSVEHLIIFLGSNENL